MKGCGVVVVESVAIGIQDIRQSIADTLGIELSRVGLKGKTGEGVDSVGKELAIQAQCVALLQDSNSAT